MSFTFRPARGGEAWSADGKRRTLSEVRLGHVAVLTGLPPAYRQTSASIRSLAWQLGAELDDLDEAIAAFIGGAPLDARTVHLLRSAIAALAEPAMIIPASIAASIPVLSLARARLELLAKAR